MKKIFVFLVVVACASLVLFVIFLGAWIPYYKEYSQQQCVVSKSCGYNLWLVRITNYEVREVIGTSPYELQENKTLPCWIPHYVATNCSDFTDSQLALLNVRAITPLFGLWVCCISILGCSIFGILYFGLLLWRFPQVQNKWTMQTWKKVPESKGNPMVKGISSAILANAFARICNGLDILNVVLIFVFAIGVGAEKFQSNFAVYLTLVLLVVAAQIPHQFGEGIVAHILPERSVKMSMNEYAMVAALVPTRFAYIQSSVFVIQILMIFLASFPIGCEVLGSSAGTHCKSIENQDVTVVTYVLAIVVFDALLRIVSVALYVGVACFSPDAGFVIWNAVVRKSSFLRNVTFVKFLFQRLNSPNDVQGYLKLNRVLRLPENGNYIARHLYHLSPYKSLIFPEFGVLSAGFTPKVAFFRENQKQKRKEYVFFGKEVQKRKKYLFFGEKVDYYEEKESASLQDELEYKSQNSSNPVVIGVRFRILQFLTYLANRETITSKEEEQLAVVRAYLTEHSYELRASLRKLLYAVFGHNIILDSSEESREKFEKTYSEQMKKEWKEWSGFEERGTNFLVLGEGIEVTPYEPLVDEYLFKRFLEKGKR